MSEHHWTIILAAANREKHLAEAIKDAGHLSCLPTRRTWRGRYARHAEIRRPVVPGYVFAVIAPHQIHAFHADGAIRILQVSTRAQQAIIDTCVEGWMTDSAAGVFDDPEPPAVKAKVKPIRHRNRGERRAKREALKWEEGLKSALAALDVPKLPMAA